METKILLLFLFVGFVMTAQGVGIYGNLRPATLEELMIDENCVDEFLGEKMEGATCGDWNFEESQFIKTHHSVRVQWFSDGNFSDPVKYDIYKKVIRIGNNYPYPNPQFKYVERIEVSGYRVQYSFSDLEPSSLYEVKVVRHCDGIISYEKIMFTTEDDPIHDVPENKNCIPDWNKKAITGTSSSSSITLNWPSGGASAFYLVDYRRDFPQELPWIRSNPEGITVRTRNLPNLEDERGYDVRVTRVCTGTVDQVIYGNYDTKREPINACFGIWWGIDKNKSSETDRSVSLGWGKIKSASYKIWYREEGNSGWIYKGTTGGDSFIVDGLKKSTDYEFRVEKNCGSNRPEVDVEQFRTNCCPTRTATCYPVSDLSHSNVTPFSAVIDFKNFNIGNLNASETVSYHWKDEYGVSTYKTPWGLGEQTTEQTIGTLKPNTKYTYWITKRCSAVTGMSTSKVGTFTTPPFTECPKPTGLKTDYVNFYDAKVEWDIMQGASDYTLATRVKGTNDWVTFFVAQEERRLPNFYSELSANTSYEVVVRSNCTSYNLPASEWSDLLSFTTPPDPCPLLSPSGFKEVSSSSSVNRKVQWNAVSGAANYTVAISLSDRNDWNYYTTYTTHLETYFVSGYDYKVIVKANCSNAANLKWDHNNVVYINTKTCPMPSGLQKIYVNSNDGKVAWNSVSEAASYTLSVRANGGSWTELPITETEVSAPLMPGTKYELVLKSHCSNKEDSDWNWADMLTFTTPLSVCPKPTGLRTVYINSNDGEVAWNPVSGATSYTLLARANGGGLWTPFTTTNTSMYSPLGPGTKYEIVLKSHCPNIPDSDWNWDNMLTFWTPGLSVLKSGNSTASKSARSIIYPNTNNGSFKIKYKKGKQVKSMSIYDAYGIKVFSKKYNETSGVERDEFNLSYKLKSGVYKVRIQTDEGIEYETLLVEH